jgi:hypothetical protein
MSASSAARVPGAAPPRSSRRRGLLGRLAATHLLVAGAALVVAALWLPRAVEQYEIANLERQLADEARLVRRLAAPLTREQRSFRLQALMRRLGTEVGARVTITGVDGRVLADSLHDPGTMENHANRPEIRVALRVGLGQSMRYSRTLGMDRLYVAVPVWREEEPQVRSGPARPPSPSLIPGRGASCDCRSRWQRCTGMCGSCAGRCSQGWRWRAGWQSRCGPCETQRWPWRRAI